MSQIKLLNLDASAYLAGLSVCQQLKVQGAADPNFTPFSLYQGIVGSNIQLVLGLQEPNKYRVVIIGSPK